MEGQIYPGRGLSRTSLILNGALLVWLGVLTIVAMVVGGLARYVALPTSVGMVVTIWVLIYRMVRTGGSLKITPELVAFGGERIYFRDIEGVERGPPDRANQTFRIDVRTRDRVHRLDLMLYRIEPEAMPALLEELQGAVAHRKGRPPGTGRPG